MVGRDDIDSAIRESFPNRVDVFAIAQRRIADVLLTLWLQKFFPREVEVDGTRLREHRAARTIAASAPNLIDRCLARQVHEVRGRASEFRHLEAAEHGGRFRERRTARGEVRDAAISRSEQTLGAVTDQMLIFGVDGEQRLRVGGHFERAQKIASAILETAHHENLETGDASFDDLGNFRDHLRRRVQDCHVESIIDDRAPTRLVIPLGNRLA
jgi:hypothetical protein